MRDTGVEPVSSVWKTDILADIRIPHANANTGDYTRKFKKKHKQYNILYNKESLVYYY